MPTTSTWKRGLIGSALVLIGLTLAWTLLDGLRAAVSNWLFPQEVELFIAEGRTNGDFQKDFERVYPSQSQRRDGIRVVVRQVARDQVLRSSGELLAKFEQTRNAGESSKLFIELPAPYSCSEKELRKDIDDQNRFTGHARVAVLRRVVAIVGARTGDEQDTCSERRDACDRLSDDWAYAKWSFGGGIGLAVDDRTMDLVGNCLPRLIIEGK